MPSSINGARSQLRQNGVPSPQERRNFRQIAHGTKAVNTLLFSVTFPDPSPPGRQRLFPTTFVGPPLRLLDLGKSINFSKIDVRRSPPTALTTRTNPAGGLASGKLWAPTLQRLTAIGERGAGLSRSRVLLASRSRQPARHPAHERRKESTTDLRREHLIDQICVQAILPPES